MALNLPVIGSRIGRSFLGKTNFEVMTKIITHSPLYLLIDEVLVPITRYDILKNNGLEVIMYHEEAAKCSFHLSHTFNGVYMAGKDQSFPAYAEIQNGLGNTLYSTEGNIEIKNRASQLMAKLNFTCNNELNQVVSVQGDIELSMQ